ncbi:hypothetical protein BEP19_02995 [Ammoniphilus oxalaticus]|uniref:Uncharacterized protein n=1 Tax=Ammoniphilus oxalaticus TaxID=66863 RepID=A0A419SNX2_9BACL|nr:hypothetical protein BEP19_02995 [Ammoniphilus oxalaticus]
MIKQILNVVIYFIVIFLGAYYFVNMDVINSGKFALMMSVVNIIFRFVDRYRVSRKRGHDLL